MQALARKSTIADVLVAPIRLERPRQGSAEARPLALSHLPPAPVVGRHQPWRVRCIDDGSFCNAGFEKFGTLTASRASTLTLMSTKATMSISCSLDTT